MPAHPKNFLFVENLDKILKNLGNNVSTFLKNTNELTFLLY